MRNLGKLAGKILAVIALAACLAPATAFADEAVSFGGGDIEAGDQVYLGSWDSAPISWDVESVSGNLAVHSTYILFKTQIDEAPNYDYNPNLTLETSELYTHSGEGLWFTTFPMFKNQAFSGGEGALPAGFVLSGDFGGATYPDGTGEWYWINEPLIHNTTYNCFDGTAADPDGVRSTIRVNY